ncbi:FecR domain-containing protein [Chitinophaga niabensis]|uniref:FecR family protein n=1 Tax=Chitinophaga niabensis TaxID=536979 RepID=UPI0031B9E70F
MDQQLIEKYFKGNCTAEEVERVEAYLQKGETEEMDAYLHEVWSATAEEEVIVPVKKISRWYGIAATVTMLILGGTWLWQSERKDTGRAATVHNDTVVNKSDHVQLLTLTDGSKVFMGPFSSIIYTSQYNDTSRELWLNGEAYFEVAKDSRRAFKVHTDGLVTTALGTAFNIATGNQADGSIQVSLTAGKVSVSTVSESYLLEPGQMVRYRKGKSLELPAAFNVATVLDWKNGKVVFEGTSLEDAFAKLQSRYGCTIIFDNAQLGKRKVTGVFNRNEGAIHILNVLRYVHNFSYRLSGTNHFIITGDERKQ